MFPSGCNRIVRHPIELRSETRVSSRLGTGELILLSTCRWELKVPLELQQGSWVSLKLRRGTLAPLELGLETRASMLVATGISGFHSSWGGTQDSSQLAVGPPLILSWGNSPLACMCRVAPVLLQCEATDFFWHGTSLSLWSDSTL